MSYSNKKEIELTGSSSFFRSRIFTRIFFSSACLLASLSLLGCGAGIGGEAETGPVVVRGGEPAGATSASPNAAVLSWDPVTAINLSGYRVYYGTASGTYLQPLGQGINVGSVTTYTVTGLSSGTTYYFTVTSVDTSGNESAFSTEVSKTIN